MQNLTRDRPDEIQYKAAFQTQNTVHCAKGKEREKRMKNCVQQ